MFWHAEANRDIPLKPLTISDMTFSTPARRLTSKMNTNQIGAYLAPLIRLQLRQSI